MDEKKLMKLSTNYPPRIRALLGALIEIEFKSSNIKNFKKRITSKGSFYKAPIKARDLPNSRSWNILTQ